MSSESMTAVGDCIFGKFPTVADSCRYGAAALSDYDWIVWDYREGRAFTSHGITTEEAARLTARDLNRTCWDVGQTESPGAINDWEDVKP